MKYYSESITNLIEELASLPKHWSEVSTAAGTAYFKSAGSACETFSGQYIDGKAEDLFLQRMF